VISGLHWSMLYRFCGHVWRAVSPVPTPGSCWIIRRPSRPFTTSVAMSRTLSAASLNRCNKWTTNWSCRARTLITSCQRSSSKICLQVAHCLPLIAYIVEPCTGRKFTARPVGFRARPVFNLKFSGPSW